MSKSENTENTIVWESEEEFLERLMLSQLGLTPEIVAERELAEQKKTGRT